MMVIWDRLGMRTWQRGMLLWRSSIGGNGGLGRRGVHARYQRPFRHRCPLAAAVLDGSGNKARNSLLAPAGPYQGLLRLQLHGLVKGKVASIEQRQRIVLAKRAAFLD
mmetsp:Transcript_7187/g.22208  ORF Transcript_7187/g.22208 Transcript_7187/m.22208 type:complete len:108 (+) Transcript_7187:479-802(+)